jgi:hypothetical protein
MNEITDRQVPNTEPPADWNGEFPPDPGETGTALDDDSSYRAQQTSTQHTMTGSSVVISSNATAAAPLEQILAQKGLSLYPTAIAERTVIRLGSTGMIQHEDGRSFFPIVLRFLNRPAAVATIERGVRSGSLTNLMHRIRRGWTEKTADGHWVQHVIALETDAAGTVGEEIVAQLAARTATIRMGTAMISLAVLRTKPTAIAPSTVADEVWVHSAGSQGIPTTVTVAELFGLGALLDAISAQSDKSSIAVFDSHMYTSRICQARDYINRKVGANRITRLLTLAGWVPTDLDGFQRQTWVGPDGVGTAYVGGQTVPAGTVRIVEEDTDGRLPVGLYRPFDVMAALDSDDAGRPFAGDVETLAEYLISSKETRVGTGMLLPSVRVNVDVETSWDVQAEQIVEAARDARSRTNSEMPFVLQRTTPVVGGRPGETGPVVALTSVNAVGDLEIWEKSIDLIAAIAQPAKFFPPDLPGDEPEVRSMVANFQPGVISMVERALWQSGQLSTFAYYGAEPVLTPRGIVSVNGYHARERALVCIPDRERAMWETRYTVPKTLTLADAQAAVGYVAREVQADFPYRGPGDQARHLLFLLTAVARPILSAAPFIIAAGAEAGTGKDKSLAVGRIIATGSATTSKWSGGKSDEEDIKQLAACVLNGGRFMHNSEVVATSSGKVESLMVTVGVTMTDGEQKVRKLGFSQEIPVVGVIYTAAGNGVELGGDLQRRTFIYEMLVPDGVVAAARTGWRHADLEMWVRNHRPELLAAMHTIIAFGLANPVQVPSESSSGNWASIILGALEHVELGGQNARLLALDNRAAQLGKDTFSEEWGDYLDNLWRYSAGEPFTAHDMRMWQIRFQDAWPKKLAAANGPTGTYAANKKSAKGADSAISGAFKGLQNRKATVADGIIRIKLASEKRGNTFQLVKHPLGATEGQAPLGAPGPRATGATVDPLDPQAHLTPGGDGWTK